ncbi:hypothetical protein CEP49_06700 [Mergibacter septicus]|uniref:hypothetical protein n=1 Tax=Mergibacter septicus TaxID=221402 RepID=UPI00117965DE|nr:hypothetical protein [Mergibacter septicus]AWX14260.1 hypothetical protein CEP49_06700 [Mergibacter septicus]
MFISNITSIFNVSIFAVIGILLAFLSFLRAKNKALKQDLRDERHQNVKLEMELINAKKAAKILSENMRLSDDDVDKQLHERAEYRD